MGWLQLSNSLTFLVIFFTFHNLLYSAKANTLKFVFRGYFFITVLCKIVIPLQSPWEMHTESGPHQYLNFAAIRNIATLYKWNVTPTVYGGNFILIEKWWKNIIYIIWFRLKESIKGGGKCCVFFFQSDKRDFKIFIQWDSHMLCVSSQFELWKMIRKTE